MKSHFVALLERLIRESGEICSVDTTRDIETVTRRVGDQGLSFLTITLPAFESDFIRSLDDGQVAPTSFPGFSRAGGRFPAFLSGFLELVFDRSTGVLLDTPNIGAIRAVRQICLAVGKARLECSPDRVRKALEGFVKCELELSNLSDQISPEDRDRFRVIGNMLFSGVFSQMNELVSSFMVDPKHGPGATADKLIANAKYTFPTWTRRLEDVFPYWRYATSTPFSSVRMSSVEFHEPGQELPVKVVCVPKTLKTPRIIAIEPTHMQYMQQGLLRGFTDGVEGDNLLKHFISSKYQEPNQQLALKGSRDGSLATLDLSEASDRVSNFLVEDLTMFFPHLYDGVQACRSKTASVPVISKDYKDSSSMESMTREIIALNKFASMGSALCFPMEMAVFLTVVFMGIEAAKGSRFRRKGDFSPYVGSVRVYGDDIIVPVDATSSVIAYLTRFGFVVNRRKSFWTGKFRESCGADYYDGHDVTITRVRESWPASRRDVKQIVSAVSLRNQLYKAGYFSTADWLTDELSKLIHLPVVADTSDVLGLHSYSLSYEVGKMCPRLHRPMVKGWKVKDIPRNSVADGYAALMKFFLKKGDEPIFAEDHLIHAGRPITSKITYGWGYSY